MHLVISVLTYNIFSHFDLSNLLKRWSNRLLRKIKEKTSNIDIDIHIQSLLTCDQLDIPNLYDQSVDRHRRIGRPCCKIIMT